MHHASAAKLQDLSRRCRAPIIVTKAGGGGECVPVHREGTSGQADAASVYGYTGTIRAHNQGTSGHPREEDAASVYGYTGTLLVLCEQTAS